MCRILGYFGNKKVPVKQIQKAMEMQYHGGPDSQYIEQGKNWVLANNRLAIQGIEGGKQPFHLEHKIAVYNGELYNHHTIRQKLITQNYHLNDRCDGAVILPLYHEFGLNFVDHIEGMYAIAIVDEKEQQLILSVDHSAIKSLYYYYDQNTDTLFFASELKALLKLPVPKKLREESIDEYLIGRSVWNDKTFYENIYCLTPGQLLIKRINKQPKIKTSHKIKKNNYRFNSLDEAGHVLDSLLSFEVERMLDADVPVCLVTSGGLDSSYISQIAARHRENLTCFNVAYEGSWPSEERHFAKEVADFCKLKYHQVLIKDNEYPDLLNKTIQALDQPNSAPHALSTFALFSEVHKLGYKVAITGEGADEFFGGYKRFQTATFSNNPDWQHYYFDLMGATTAALRNNVYHETFASSSQLITKACNDLDCYEMISKSRLKALLKLDHKARFPGYILRRVDHISAANSVEVRVPFCQPEIISLASQLPDDYLLDTQSVKKIVYSAAKNKLPQSILDRPKQPFTLPIIAMLQPGHALFDIMYSTLTSHQFCQRHIFNTASINKLLHQQITKPNNHTANLLWTVMILEIWLAQHF